MRSTIGDVAVVVVDWNSGDLVDRCLSAVAGQTVRPKRTVVVDNASATATRHRLTIDTAGLDLVRLPGNRGFAAGSNHGAGLASDVEWIALLNPDAFPEPGWLERLLVAAESNPDFSFFASRQLQADDPSRLDGTGDAYAVSGLAWRRDHGLPAAARREQQGEVFGPCAAAALYRRRAWLEAGGLDESFFCYFEDVDLAFRLRLLGQRCLYVPEAVVRHVGSGVTGRRSDFSVYHGHRNLVWTFWKNMPGPLLVRYWPHHLAVNGVSVVHFGTRGRGSIILRAKRDALRGLPSVLRQRRTIQRHRKVGLTELRSVMTGGWRSQGVGADKAPTPGSG
jgi:GT2 family glycosyltransferase